MASFENRFPRRDLLRGASALALASAFPTIIPASALGRDGDSPNERIRVGHIGVRNQGTHNLKQLMKSTVAVCDVDRDVLAKARKLAEEGTGHDIKTYHDYRALLDDKEIDAVVITTPDHWHARMTVDACEAGKDVYCEKPLSLTVVEGRAMVEAARKTNRIVQTGSQQRSAEEFRKACELVRNGRIGKLRRIVVGLPAVNFDGPAVPDTDPPAELDYDFWLGPAPLRPYNPKHVHYLFRFFWDYSGGQMTNFGAHHLDIVQWALGRDNSGPSKIEGEATYDEEKRYEVPKTSRITFTYDDGTTVLCEQGTKGVRGGVTFEGEDGTIYVTRRKLEADPETILKEPLSGDDVRLEVSQNHFGNWLDCIRSRELPICDVEVGHRSATVCHLANIAARLGREIRWDPALEQILDDSEAAAMLQRPYRKPWVHPG